MPRSDSGNSLLHHRSRVQPTAKAQSGVSLPFLLAGAANANLGPSGALQRPRRICQGPSNFQSRTTGKAGGLKDVNRSKRLVNLAPPEGGATAQRC